MGYTLVLIIVLILAFGGGGVWSHRARSGPIVTGGFALVVLILVIVLLFGGPWRTYP